MDLLQDSRGNARSDGRGRGDGGEEEMDQAPGGGGGEGGEEGGVSFSPRTLDLPAVAIDVRLESSLLLREEGEYEEADCGKDSGEERSTTSSNPPSTSSLGLSINEIRNEKNNSLLTRLCTSKPFISVPSIPTTSTPISINVPFSQPSHRPLLSTTSTSTSLPLLAPIPRRLGSSCNLLEVEVEMEMEEGEIFEREEKEEESEVEGKEERRVRRVGDWSGGKKTGWDGQEDDFDERPRRNYRSSAASIPYDNAPWTREEDDLLERSIYIYGSTSRDRRRPKWLRSRGSFIEFIHHRDFPTRSLSALTTRFIDFHERGLGFWSSPSSSSSYFSSAPVVAADSGKWEHFEEEKELEEVEMELFLEGKEMRSDGIEGARGRGRGRGREKRDDKRERVGGDWERGRGRGRGEERGEWRESRRDYEDFSRDRDRSSFVDQSRLRGRSRSPSSTRYTLSSSRRPPSPLRSSTRSFSHKNDRYSVAQELTSTNYLSQFTDVGGDLVNLRNLYIANISRNADEHDLKMCFSRFGPISNSTRIRRHKDKDGRGTCFIAFEDERDAREARLRMNGQNIRGRSIHVDFHRPNSSVRKAYFQDQQHPPMIEEVDRRPRRVVSPTPTPPPSHALPPPPPYSNASLELNSPDKASSSDSEVGSSWMRETESRLLGVLVEHLEGLEMGARLALMTQLDQSTPDVRRNFLSILSAGKIRGSFRGDGGS